MKSRSSMIPFLDIVLALLLIFTVYFINNNPENLQKQIKALKKEVKMLKGEVKELKEENNKLQEELKRATKIFTYSADTFFESGKYDVKSKDVKANLQKIYKQILHEIKKSNGYYNTLQIVGFTDTDKIIGSIKFKVPTNYHLGARRAFTILDCFKKLGWDKDTNVKIVISSYGATLLSNKGKNYDRRVAFVLSKYNEEELKKVLSNEN